MSRDTNGLMMIIHNTLLAGVRDPKAATNDLQASPRERVVRFIARYPDISGAEASEIIRFIRTARYSEIALLTADETVRRQLDHFIRTHSHELHWSPINWIAPVALIAGVVASAWLVWPLL